MKLNLPQPQLILEYHHFYNDPLPENRLNIIKGTPTEALLYELAGLNYRLKPKTEIYFNDSLDFQKKELLYFLKDITTYTKYASVAERFSKSESDYPLLFTRQGCIFAIEEILNSGFKSETPNDEFGTIEHWESIVKYLLAVNTEITKIKSEKDDNKNDFESLNPKFIPLNELGIEIDPVYTPFRGYHLIKYYLSLPEYATELTEYFNENYALEPEAFILNILQMYLANSSENPELNFFYYVIEPGSYLFDVLSKRNPSIENHKLLNIRKSPFIKVASQKYVITDNTFLLEKCYSQFLNDFWFDKLKTKKNPAGKNIFNIQKFRSDFGYFFESYLDSILRYSFSNYKHSKLLTFEELKISSKQGEIELADFYLRHNNKILIGQVKSGNIYDAEKFGGDVEALYKKDRNKFFENFGVNQIVESIINVHKYIIELDKNYPQEDRIKIYPCIVVNDKALQTPLMADIFNTRFKELLVAIEIPKLLIKPLTLVHVSDIETIEESLHNTPKEIWDFFDENHKGKKFIPPFYNSVYKIWKHKVYPEKIKDLYKDLMDKYTQN